MSQVLRSGFAKFFKWWPQATIYLPVASLAYHRPNYKRLLRDSTFGAIIIDRRVTKPLFRNQRNTLYFMMQ